MVVAKQGAEAVRREVDELGVEAARGLPLRSVERDHDVAEQAGIGGCGLALRERELVGWLVLAAPVAVERVDRRVVGDAQRDVEIATPFGQRGRLDHARDLAIDSGVAVPAPLRGKIRREVARMVKAAALTEGRRDLDVALRITDDETIHALNRDWRGKNKPTDVLALR